MRISLTEILIIDGQIRKMFHILIPRWLLTQMFPVGGGKDKETLRRHTLKAGAAIRDRAAVRPETAVSAITITLDSTFIRSCEEGQRHLEVRVGNVETASGGRQVFGAVAGSDTDIKMLIRRNLEAVGQTKDTALTAFTDGCAGLRRILADAGVAEPPMLDWFHIRMRLQHLKQTASALSTDGPERMAAKAVIVAEAERLHRRTWNGKAQNAQKSLNGIRTVTHYFRGEPGSKKSMAVPKVVDRVAGAGRLSPWPESLAGQLRRTPSGWIASWNRDHRRHSQFPAEPPNE